MGCDSLKSKKFTGTINDEIFKCRLKVATLKPMRLAQFVSPVLMLQGVFGPASPNARLVRIDTLTDFTQRGTPSFPRPADRR